MLEGSVIVVTGGGRGIGRGVAQAVAESGARVAVTDLDGEAAERTAAGLPEGMAIALRLDVTDGEAIETALGEVERRLGPVDGWVNNAGLIRMGPALESDGEEWAPQLAVNTEAVLSCSRRAARRMIAHGNGGAIVNVASNAGKVGYPNMAVYNASKAAVISLTRSLAREWAEHRINVNAVCPGGVDTPMLRDVAEWVSDLTGLDAGELHRGMVPEQLGRHVDPLEVGHVVAFLLSERAAIIRGQAINADGGDTPY